MGSGGYSTDVYASTAAVRNFSGTSFAHTTAMNSVAHDQRKAHDLVNAFNASVRESRDSAEHPTSVPIAVLLDVTGSMAHYPRVVQEKFPDLFNLLLLKGYCEHPQLLFGAIGDAHGDAVPIQISQFESDNRNDDNIEALYLEGRGGGGSGSESFHESYDLSLYFMARHTATDSWEQRSKRGYLFVIGDEMSYERIEPELVKRYVNESDVVEDDLTLDKILDEVREKWDLFFIIPEDHSRHCKQFWLDKLGDDRVILLRDMSEICSTIALAVGIGEGTTTLEGGLKDLEAAGANAASVGSALS